VYHLALPHSRHSLSFIVNIVIVIVIHPTNMAENVLIGTSLPISIALVHEENGRVVALVPHRHHTASGRYAGCFLGFLQQQLQKHWS
jgi:hypothetical protein